MDGWMMGGCILGISFARNSSTGSEERGWEKRRMENESIKMILRDSCMGSQRSSALTGISS